MWLVAIILDSTRLEKSLNKFRKMGFGSHCLYLALPGGTLICFPEDPLAPNLVQRAVSILPLRIHIVILQPSQAQQHPNIIFFCPILVGAM